MNQTRFLVFSSLKDCLLPQILCANMEPQAALKKSATDIVNRTKLPLEEE